MASGTFYIFPKYSTVAAWTRTGNLYYKTASDKFVLDADGIAPFVGGVISGFAGTVEVPFSTGEIYLDGNPTPVILSGLPTGFTITSAEVCLGGSAYPASGYPGPTELAEQLTLTGNTFGYCPTTSGLIDVYPTTTGRLQLALDPPYSTINYLGLNTLTVYVQWLIAADGYCELVVGEAADIDSIMDDTAGDDRGVFVRGTYTTSEWKFYLSEDKLYAPKDLTYTSWDEGTSFDPDTEAPPEGAAAYEGLDPTWWFYELPEGGTLWLYQILTPGTGWTEDSAPDHYGWWDAREEGFRGQSLIVIDAVPKRPRTFEEIVAFATGSASPQGGHPGPGVNWRSRMVYARGGYTVGTDYPPIGIFDGLSDRVLTQLPPTSSGGVPKAIMSMLVVGDLIYLTTLDSGSSSADWAGRVFSLDVNSAKLEQIGATFTTGQLPYCLAFHNGRLWVGTNTGAATAGTVRWFRPGIDTAWTTDYTLSSSSVMGALCMRSFGGKLYVGTSAAAAASAKILCRDAVGAWSTVYTGSATAANNAILAMAVYPHTLTNFSGDPYIYASYWNDGSPDTSIIVRSANGSSWSTVYTGIDDTLIPFIALVTVAEQLYAIGGGFDRAIQLLLTSNGTSWSLLTPFLPPGDEAATNILVEINR